MSKFLIFFKISYFCIVYDSEFKKEKKKKKKKNNKKNIGLITSVGEDLNSSPSQLKNKKPTLNSNLKGLFDSRV